MPEIVVTESALAFTLVQERLFLPEREPFYTDLSANLEKLFSLAATLVYNQDLASKFLHIPIQPSTSARRLP